MKLNKRQLDVLAYFIEAKCFNQKSSIHPFGIDVNIAKNLEKMGVLKSCQLFPKNHPWRTKATFGYEVRQYYVTKNWICASIPANVPKYCLFADNPSNN